MLEDGVGAMEMVPMEKIFLNSVWLVEIKK